MNMRLSSCNVLKMKQYPSCPQAAPASRGSALFPLDRCSAAFLAAALWGLMRPPVTSTADGRGKETRRSLVSCAGTRTCLGKD
ncbi:hypothetical protein NDU88_003134 [Pleurodeles waltl]|uniref:Uncharacterized protein n=1 Tax=Pleurodeles waltl TaxID=8319 RepID=A0AAV7TMM8_PLEWA|nr:hypothetical protein NDU88_003134 [Pleurodeles waltl]